jgi:RNA polymerase-binding transcription factor DksA
MTTQWPPADDAVSTRDRSEPSDEPVAPDDEDGTHRSAVDAVDGVLDEVERALARLDDGTYGRCESCGEQIGDDRLAERPVVRTCSPCEATADSVDATVTGSADDGNADTGPARPPGPSPWAGPGSVGSVTS